MSLEDELKKAAEEGDLAEKMEEIIEAKVEERLKEQEDQEEKNFSEKDTFSRREFLKKLGVGALGVGALSLAPASALNIRSSDGLEVFSGGTKHFSVKPGGNLTDGSSTIWDSSNSEVPSSVLGSHASTHSSGSGDEINVEDLATTSTTSGEVPKAQGDGTLAMGGLSHSDLSGVGASDHHTKYSHNVVASGTVTVSGGSAANISTNPGGPAAVFARSDSNGSNNGKFQITWNQQSDDDNAVLLEDVSGGTDTDADYEVVRR